MEMGELVWPRTIALVLLWGSLPAKKKKFRINICFLLLTGFWTLFASNDFLQLDFPSFQPICLSFSGILMHLHITRCEPLHKDLVFSLLFHAFNQNSVFFTAKQNCNLALTLFFSVLGCPCCVLIYFIWSLSISQMGITKRLVIQLFWKVTS